MFASLMACGSRGSGEKSIKVFKARGSVQCEEDGTTPEVMQSELINAGMSVLTFSCGFDGLGHAAVCGGSDGRMNIFEIPQGNIAQAQSLGFSNLSELPDASEGSCT